MILREIERSDNESLRLKKEVMRQFILTRFYDLPEEADVMEAFTQFEKEQMKADMEEFAFALSLITGLYQNCLRNMCSMYDF